MAKQDVESILDDIAVFLKANLNGKLTEIETEKADTVSLGPVADEAYFFATMDEINANFNPFVYYTVIGSTPILNQGYVSGTDYEFLILIVSVDNQNDGTFERKLLRWGRACKELFETNWDKIARPAKFEVSSVEPFPFKLQAGGDKYKAAGVSLKAAIFA